MILSEGIEAIYVFGLLRVMYGLKATICQIDRGAMMQACAAGKKGCAPLCSQNSGSASDYAIGGIQREFI